MTVVTLGGMYENIDEMLIDPVSKVILDAANEADPPLFVVDLQVTKFFGSAFIEVLFRARNGLVEREGGRFAVCGLSEHCAEVIQIAHLDRLWEVYDDHEKAVAALQPA